VPDVLVNNAGIFGAPGRPRDYTAADATQMLWADVVGYVRTIHAFLPLLERSSAPRIVNVSGELGFFGLFHVLERIEPRWFIVSACSPATSRIRPASHGHVPRLVPVPRRRVPVRPSGSRSPS